MNKKDQDNLRNPELKSAREKNKHILVDESLSAYIDDLLLKSESEDTKEVLTETLTLAHSEMQIPLSQARFLESIIQMTGAKKVLEIGTFWGFSSAFIARALPIDGILYTCERDERVWPIAENYWKKLGVVEKIVQKKGQGIDICQELISSNEIFDLIFVDADKGNYKQYLEYVMKLIKPKGVILLDNILWAGLVADEDPGDNVGRNLKVFNEYLFETYGTCASIIPAWDGLAVIVV